MAGMSTNSAPTGSISISGTVAQKYTNAIVVSTLADQDGLGQFSYVWKIDGTVVGNQATLQTAPDQPDVGKTLTVTVSYVDGLGNHESVTSPGRIIANTNDKPHGRVDISGGSGSPYLLFWFVSQGQVLTATNDLYDNDGLGVITYQWKANGVNIVGATSPTFRLTQDQVGKVISVSANYTDLFGTAESVEAAFATNAVRNVNDAPEGTVTINGNVVQDQILSAANTLTDADGMGLLNYQWKADNVNINGATGNTLRLTQAQVGKAITVVVYYTDQFGALETVQSSPTVPVATLLPADATPPTISISSSNLSLKSIDTAIISFALSEASTNFVVSDVAVTGGSLTNFNGSGTNYTATFTPTPNTTTNAVINVSSGKFTDAAGNANADGADANNSVTIYVNAVANAPVKGSGNSDAINTSRGDDAIDGGAGFDTVLVGGSIANYTITKIASGYTLTDKTGFDGSDTLLNIESIKFTDKTINLTVQAKAAAAPAPDVTRLVELYTAFFNRVPDADGMSFWIDEMKAGKAINQIAEAFYNAGVNYASLTGFSSTMSNADFINVIYRNVLGRKDGADAGGLAFWEAELTSGRASRGTLVTNILDSAHTFKGNATWGWVTDLLDNKITVAKKFSIDMGLNYNSPEASISNGMAIASAITSTDTTAALTLIGVPVASLQLG
jgi:hypothetical protein